MLKSAASHGLRTFKADLLGAAAFGSNPARTELADVLYEAAEKSGLHQAIRDMNGPIRTR